MGKVLWMPEVWREYFCLFEVWGEYLWLFELWGDFSGCLGYQKDLEMFENCKF
jgi:hypothetical protein